MLWPGDGPPADREGIRLRGRWGRVLRVPWDEVQALDGDRLTLRSGETRALPPAHRSDAERALVPPGSTGDRVRDARALLAYVSGPWSPVRAARTLLAMADATAASDVHLEAGPAGFTARMRVAGDLADFGTLPGPAGRRLLAALKLLSGCLPYRSDLVQEGRIPRDGVAADVRASFLPTALGERAALRLFGRLLALADLGLDPAARGGLEEALGHRSGLVLVAGPSGAGKTTTVYAALGHVAARRGGAHLSIEDPVEQRLRLAGIPVDQVELCPERGLTAEAVLAGALRQDVDVVALGEVRRAGEARLAVEAAHTGRLVIAGIHAGSATEARQRMLDLGADPRVLGLTLRAVLHQRLESIPCPDGDAAGCPHCRGAGRLRRPVASAWRAGEEP